MTFIFRAVVPKCNFVTFDSIQLNCSPYININFEINKYNTAVTKKSTVKVVAYIQTATLFSPSVKKKFYKY